MSQLSTFEKLDRIASGTGEVYEMARTMIGHAELALLLAKAALTGTSETLSATTAAEVLGMSRDGARKKIENCAIREPSKS
jgi:response regulator of citrate/malate metabolism